MSVLSVALLACALSLGPTLLYALLLWWLDRYEKEPLPLLLVAFLWGAMPAIILALVFEYGADIPLDQILLTEKARQFTGIGLIAPVVEEAVKAVILIVLFVAYRREFDNVLDGILYGAMVGLGFAFVENTLYFIGAAYPDEMLTGPPDVGNMLGLWVFRSGIFGLNHSMFTALTGGALGLARSLKTRWQSALVVALGLGAAMLFHALHNSLVTVVDLLADDEPSTGYVLGACLGVLVSDWGGVMLVLVLAVVSGVHEAQVIRHNLWEEVSLGRFTPNEYATLVSGRARWSARWRVLLSSGFGRWRQVGKFFDLSTELAFRKHRMHDGDPIHQAISARDVARLRYEIDSLKRRMIGVEG